jgi:hypothetical protein
MTKLELQNIYDRAKAQPGTELDKIKWYFETMNNITRGC